MRLYERRMYCRTSERYECVLCCRPDQGQGRQLAVRRRMQYLHMRQQRRYLRQRLRYYVPSTARTPEAQFRAGFGGAGAGAGCPVHSCICGHRVPVLLLPQEGQGPVAQRAGQGRGGRPARCRRLILSPVLIQSASQLLTYYCSSRQEHPCGRHSPSEMVIKLEVVFSTVVLQAWRRFNVRFWLVVRRSVLSERHQIPYHICI